MFKSPFSIKFKQRKIKSSLKEDIEPHEIILDSLAKRREEEAGVSEKRLEVPLVKRILQLFYIACLLVISIIFAKTFQFQIVEGEIFQELAQENKFIIHQIQAERGIIYDRNMQQLVFNEPRFDLVLNFRDFPELEFEKERILKSVSEITKEDYEEIKKKIEEAAFSKVIISENLEHQELILLETKLKELPGFQIENNAARQYWQGPAFAHLIGYTGKITSEEFQISEDYSITDWVGRNGLEKYYENVLRKNPGELRIEMDALGNIISKETISLPESGNSLVLWLDSGLQEKIKAELENILPAVGSKKAVGVALDPRTGGVLALISLPGFDNNLFNKGADPEALQNLLKDAGGLKPLFNRAIQGKYLTGSTIKPFIASAALEENIIDSEKEIYCRGFIEVPHQYDPEITYQYDDWSIHGLVDMRKAIAESCNVYFYTIGGGYGDQKGLGPTKIKEYLELFGWNQKTGIDLPAEANGFIPDKEWKKEVFNEGWWDGDTYYLSIGQQYLQITPLEVVNSFASIANGGTLYEPRLVKEIINSDKETIKTVESEIIRQNFIEPDNLKIVREGMRQAVTGKNSPQASSIILNSLPVSSAAKTGTAELGNNYYNNWVTVFAPYENPEIVLTIMIEEVKDVQAAALPVARAVLEWYFTR